MPSSPIMYVRGVVVFTYLSTNIIFKKNERPAKSTHLTFELKELSFVCSIPQGRREAREGSRLGQQRWISESVGRAERQWSLDAS